VGEEGYKRGGVGERSKVGVVFEVALLPPVATVTWFAASHGMLLPVLDSVCANDQPGANATDGGVGDNDKTASASRAADIKRRS